MAQRGRKPKPTAIKELEGNPGKRPPNSVDESDEKESGLGIESLEVFENIAWTMAKHADPDHVPESPDEWLEQFNTFSIYEVLPQLFELWGVNLETQAESKKSLVQLTAK